MMPLIMVAQEDEPPHPARQRIEELRKVKMLEALHLNEDQSVRLLAREKEFRQSQKQLNDRRHESILRLKTLVDKKAGDDELMKEMQKCREIQNGIDRENEGVCFWSEGYSLDPANGRVHRV